VGSEMCIRDSITKDLAARGYCGLQGTGRLENPKDSHSSIQLPISRKAVTVRSEDSLYRRSKFVGLGETIDLANPSPVCRRTLYLFTLGGLSEIFKKLRTGIPGAED